MNGFKSNNSADKGGILILLVFLLPVFLTLAALVIDYGIASSGSEQHQNITNAGAIVALETWLRQYVPANGNQVSARNNALARSIAITNLNVTLSQMATDPNNPSMDLSDIGLAGAGASNGTIRFGRWWFTCPAGGCVDTCMNTSPVSCMDGLSTPECFQQLDPAAACATAGLNQADFINSVRLDLNYAANSLSPAIFSKVLGYAGFGSNVTATAATIPTHVVFVGDLSDSMREETHLMRRSPTDPPNLPPAAPGYPASPYQQPGVTVPYSLLLTGQAAGACNAVGGPCSGFGAPGPAPVTTCRCQCSQPCPGAPSTCAFGLALARDMNNFYGTTPPSTTEAAPPGGRPTQGLYDTRASWPAGPPPPPTRHFKDDYQCVSVTYDENRGAGVVTYTEDYLIDTRQNLAPADGLGVASPTFASSGQPFGTVLSAVYLGAQALSQRNVPGDLVGALFFDRYIMQSPAGARKRQFPLTEPLQANVAFQQLQDAVNVDNTAFGPPNDLITPLTYPNNIAQFVLFPRVISPGTETVANRERSHTDIPLALNTALNMLTSAPNFSISHNVVVLLTDSIQTCITNNGTQAVPNFPNPASPATPLPFCTDQENTGGASLWRPSFWNDLRAITIPNYWRAQVPIHLFSVGEHIGPNTINLLNSSGSGLLTEGEARSNELSLTYLGFPRWNRAAPYFRVHYELRSAEWPLFSPTYYMYHAARWTHGGYFPIRKVDLAAGVGNTAINAGRDPFGTLLPITNIPYASALPESSAVGAPIDSTQNWASTSAVGYLGNPNSQSPFPGGAPQFRVPHLPPYRGVVQRFDPQGRTIYTQIQDAMGQIIGNPSISLVSSP